MSFKRLNSDDFSVSVAPIITMIDPLPTYDTKSKTGDGVLAVTSGLPNITGINDGFNNVLSFKRKDFKQSIHPESFSLANEYINSSSVEITKAGRKYNSSAGTYNLYPDIGLVTCDSTPAVTSFCSEETLTTSYVTIRILPSEFNYSTNPSFAADGEARIKDTYLLNPVTYITTIGLYNDDKELIAVAKTGRPLRKDFVTSYSLRVQLDF